MRSISEGKDALTNGDQTDTLFTALAEQLKTPLLQIARLSEISESGANTRISVISEHALRLVDAYMQAQSQAQTKLLLEPFTTSSVLYDVANSLKPFANQYNYDLEIDVRGKSLPVMAHRISLRAMLTLLGASLIEAGSADVIGKRYLVLGTHRSAKGTVVGVFSNQVFLSQKALQLTRQLHGRAVQPIPSLGQAGGAGLAIADRLSHQLSAPLRAYRHQSLTGIGSLLLPSRQLQLVV
ncbi:MAG TPA: hypothetical protein VM124_03265 [Candidatus Limnocylindrales bacterium]|nr:hypothetical protein [Candidatus Limnocylindrales bacterium]